MFYNNECNYRCPKSLRTYKKLTLFRQNVFQNFSCLVYIIYFLFHIAFKNDIDQKKKECTKIILMSGSGSRRKVAMDLQLAEVTTDVLTRVHHESER